MLTLKKNIYLLVCFWLCWVFVAVCGLFSGCGEQGLLPNCSGQAFHCHGFSCCGTHTLGVWASVVATPGLQNTGSRVVVHKLSCSRACGIFSEWDQSHISSIGRPILYHGAARETPHVCLFIQCLVLYLG